jgi:hypothetical protein
MVSAIVLFYLCPMRRIEGNMVRPMENTSAKPGNEMENRRSYQQAVRHAIDFTSNGERGSFPASGSA